MSSSVEFGYVSAVMLCCVLLSSVQFRYGGYVWAGCVSFRLGVSCFGG